MSKHFCQTGHVLKQATDWRSKPLVPLVKDFAGHCRRSAQRTAISNGWNWGVQTRRKS